MLTNLNTVLKKVQAGGYGLSYTTFAMSGARPGVAVPQVYVEDPVSSVVIPDQRLCAFTRVPP